MNTYSEQQSTVNMRGNSNFKAGYQNSWGDWQWMAGSRESITHAQVFYALKTFRPNWSYPLILWVSESFKIELNCLIFRITDRRLCSKATANLIFKNPIRNEIELSIFENPISISLNFTGWIKNSFLAL